MGITGEQQLETTFSQEGGWFSNRQASTGTVSGLKSVTKYVVAATMIVSAGTGVFVNDLDLLRQSRLKETMSNQLSSHSYDETYSRTPAEDIQRIREVLSPSMSDLAKSFNVSRQTIYNWLNGEQPKDEYSARLQDLALAADIIAEAEISVNGLLLKRRTIKGKNLFEVVRDGGSAQYAARLLVQIVNREAGQRERLTARLAGRKPTLHSADSDLMAENDAV